MLIGTENRMQPAPSPSINDDDGALIGGLQRGDDAAYATLVNRHGDYLYRVALRVTRNETEAGEAVQEAFISTFRSIGNFEGRSSLKTWLHRLTVNAALMRRRSAARKNEVSIEELASEVDIERWEPEWDFAESSESLLMRQGVRDAVNAAMEKLPEQYRILIILRDIEGYDTREVAAMLNDNEGNVKVRLHRARSALKKLLEPLYRGKAI
jgi:RNA polymerase sigma-70 factor (ECF subfamily)